MEGEFTVEYLGCSVLSKATTSGLGSIQKPLRDKYIEYRKNSKNKKQSQTVGLRVSRDGLTVLFPGSLPGQANQMFYDFPSINYYEAVQFVAMKGADKKIVAGFVPVDKTHNPTSDKLFTHLEKKHQNLVKMAHPAMLACVMRRTSGVRMLESYFFVTENEGDALRLVAYLRSHQERGIENEPPFHRYGSDIRYPPPSNPENYGMQRNDVDRSNPGRPTNFPDEPFRGDRHSGGRNPNMRRDMDDPDDRYLGNADTVPYERPAYRGPPGAPGDPFLREENKIYHERQRSGELERYGDKKYIHERQRSDEDRGFQRQGEINRADRHSIERFPRPQGRDDQQGRMPRVTSPGRFRDPPSTAPKPTRALSPGPRGQNSAISSGLPRQPFDDRPTGNYPMNNPVSPRGPPPAEPFYSASNLESRQEAEQSKHGNKPVAKVPPHLVAGVRVLPFGLKDALPKKVPAEPSRYDDDDEDPYDNAVSRQEFYANKDYRKNIRSEGDHWEFGGGSDKDYNQKGGGYAPPDIVPNNEKGRDWRDRPGEENYRKYNLREDYDDPNYDQRGNDIFRKHSARDRERDSDRFSEPIVENNNKPWTFDSEFKKFSKGGSINRGDGHVPLRGSSRKEDGEVNDQFSKLNVHDGPHSSDLNLEKQLGYLP